MDCVSLELLKTIQLPNSNYSCASWDADWDRKLIYIAPRPDKFEIWSFDDNSGTCLASYDGYQSWAGLHLDPVAQRIVMASDTVRMYQLPADPRKAVAEPKLIKETTLLTKQQQKAEQAINHSIVTADGRRILCQIGPGSGPLHILDAKTLDKLGTWPWKFYEGYLSGDALHLGVASGETFYCFDLARDQTEGSS